MVRGRQSLVENGENYMKQSSMVLKVFLYFYSLDTCLILKRNYVITYVRELRGFEKGLESSKIRGLEHR